MTSRILKLSVVTFFAMLSTTVRASDWMNCLLLKAKPLTAEDRRLFSDSKSGPVLSGAVPAPESFMKLYGQNLSSNLVNHWHVYFIGADGKPCFDSPTETMSGLEKRLNLIAARRAELFDIHQPLRIFFTCGDMDFAFPSSMGNGWTKYSGEHKVGDNEYIGRKRGISLRIGDSVQSYDFKEDANIIFLSAGNEFTGSAWNDDFVLAHEIAHGNEFKFMLPSYFREGQADFKAHLSTGLMNTSLPFGALRDISNPDLKNVDSFFSQFSPVADNYDLGRMLAHVFYGMWDKLIEMDLQVKMGGYLNRVADLLLSESPDVIRDGTQVKYNYKTRFQKADAVKVMDFLASVSVQWTLEQKLPRELTEWMCLKWSKAGAKGPFRRYRLSYVDSEGIRTVDDFEERYDDVNIPATWKNCDDLMRALRLGQL